MTTEQQKYDSGIFKNIGLAFLAPIGSIVFQVVVFKKNLMDSNLTMGIIISVIGCILLYLGRVVIREKK